MLTRLVAALRQVHDRLGGLLGRVCLEQLCRDEGMTWRDRVLDPVTTVHLFLVPILNGNTAAVLWRVREAGRTRRCSTRRP